MELMVSQGHSTYGISKKLGKSQTTVRYWLKKFGISTLPRSESQKYECKFCGETDKNKFVNKGNGVLSRSKCKRCHNQKTILRFRKYKLMAVQYKGGECVECGYNRCAGSMHFHHRDPTEKDINWKKMRHWSLDKIKEELDKCDLMCGNCHGEIHWGYGLMG